MNANRQKLSLPKRLLFQFVIVLFVLGLMETLSLAYLNFSYFEIQKHRRRMAQMDPVTARTSPHDDPMMVHPYLGMVYQPQEKELAPELKGFHVTDYGFYDDGPPIRKRGPDRVIVAFTGGSVARQLSLKSIEIFQTRLETIPEFRGKTFEFVRLAIDGNKQPQQLMTLNYLLALGGEFDLLMNLDGVNEIALPSIDNLPGGVADFFPRKWGQLTSAAISRDLARSIGYQTYLRARQRDCADWFDHGLIAYSPTGCWIWATRNAAFDDAVRAEFFRSKRIRDNGVTVGSMGPHQNFVSQQEVLTHCAEIWARSSELMHELCQANDILYFHFLQPNQYLPDSKPIEQSERLVAIDPASPFGGPIRDGYPLMRAMAPRLISAGVVFTDLTQIFAGHPEPIYKDDCCHVNAGGDRILAEAMTDRIVEYYARQSGVESSSDP